MKKNKYMLRFLRFTAAVVTCASIYFFAPWQYALYYLSPLPERIQVQVDQGVSQGLTGLIVYVDQSGYQPETFVSGWHDRQAKIPAMPDALFKIASIGKLYDAAVIAKLVADNTIDLDKTVADYLPHIASRIVHANSITIEMLVQHRSGIPNFTDHPDFSWDTTSLNALELILDEPADFIPNTEYAYSNSNYLLLQMIMSNVLGYPYFEYIKRELLTPLKLSNTYESVNDVPQDMLMSGYYAGYDDDVKHLNQGYVASARDVGVFLRALNDGTLFTVPERAIYQALYEFEHTGWVLGYYSIARYHPDIDAVVIQFVNLNGGDTILLSDIVYSRIVRLATRRRR